MTKGRSTDLTNGGCDKGKRRIFEESENGEMNLRRGFAIVPGEKVLVVEDVITTGGSVQEVMHLVEKSGGIIIGLAIIVDRSNGSVILHDNQFSLVSMEAVSYDENDIPESLAAIPTTKPGSRSISK